MDLFEAEEFAVKRPPLVHIAAIDIMREVVEIIEADAFRLWVTLGQPVELRIVDRTPLSIGFDEIQHRPADTDDRWNVQRLVVALIRRRTFCHRMIESMFGIDHTPSHRRSAWAVLVDKSRSVRIWLCIKNVVDIALSPHIYLLGLVTGHGHIAHASKELFKLFGLRMRKFDEFESIRSSGVVRADRGFRCVVRKRAHMILHSVTSIIAQTARNVLAFQRSVGVSSACFVRMI